MLNNLKAYKPGLCIYHGNCDDGFTAAWAIRTRWPDIEFYAGAYGVAPPDVKGKNVLLVDFSYKYDVLSELSWKARSIVILDHHKTAQADLSRFFQFDGSVEGLAEAFFHCGTNNIPDVAVHFDMEHSGAMLAWRFANPALITPEFIKYVQDRDLWKFEFGDRTKQFSATLRTYPMDFPTWDKLVQMPDFLVEQGVSVLRAHQSNIRKFLEDRFETKIGGFHVPCVNVPYHYASDTAHELLQVCPDAPFAATCFRNKHGSIQFSLRSEDSRVDVSEVAKTYGGGGHRNAAGFNLKVDDAWPIVRGIE